MLLDIIIGFPILVTIFWGFRDGLVKKIVATVVMLFALYIAQISRHSVGEFLISAGVASSEKAPTISFLLVFLGICILQMILYRIIAGKYKLGGLGDKIAGAAIGLIEGVIFMSAILMVLTVYRFPSHNLIKTSQLYKPIVNVAPQILDVVVTIHKESQEVIEKIEDEVSSDKSTTSPEPKAKTDKSKPTPNNKSK
ncbi:MAG TPA: CvpA family protein [Bacteroidota bacterium]|nr:CvpA family protein [Bacteroidota bacterium]